jgi:hypothetical protein
MDVRIACLGSLTAAVMLAGCVGQPVYEGPRTDSIALLKVRADGIYAHPAYPDDVVWARLYRSGSLSVLDARKLTVEMPIAKFAVDAGTGYVVEFVSTEAQFGGYTNCVARTELTPLPNERYALTYRTAKSSCRVESSLLDISTGRYTMLTTHTGEVRGARATR